MSILAESDIERFVIEMLMDMGYTYVYDPNISPGGVRPFCPLLYQFLHVLCLICTV